MSRFLFTTLPTDDFGLLTRSLPIAGELKLRGHEIAFCHPAKGPQILIGEAGLNNIPPVQRGSRFLRTWRVLQALVRSGTPEFWNVDHFSTLGGPDLIRDGVESLVRMIRSFEADAVVDFWNLAACIAARITAKPLITVISSFQHPQSPGFIWWKNPPAQIPTAVPWLNRILDQYGLQAIDSSGDLFIGDLTLVLGTPETDPLPETAKATYIGAVLWENPQARLPDWFATLRVDKPVVWIYPGKLRYAGKFRTWGDCEVVLTSSMDALAKEDAQVVLGVGHQDIPRSMLPLPVNFLVEPFVPGLAMAGRSDLMIHHGGYGSCQTGLYAGTPQVIVPTFSERESNARRVVAQGAGEMVLPTSNASGKRKKVDSAELAAKVRKVLTTSSYKENARRISAKLKEYGGAPEAAQLIEEMIKTRTATSAKMIAAS